MEERRKNKTRIWYSNTVRKRDLWYLWHPASVCLWISRKDLAKKQNSYQKRRLISSIGSRPLLDHRLHWTRADLIARDPSLLGVSSTAISDCESSTANSSIPTLWLTWPSYLVRFHPYFRSQTLTQVHARTTFCPVLAWKSSTSD